MNPTSSNRSSHCRCPSWKMKTSAPKEAVIDATFITIAFAGITSEPNCSSSATKVTATT